jgi:DNA invertase Pin-like site-specific DNA recombinase/predicted metal-binding protein
MKNDNKKIKYFVYVRKSTEGVERQALSIPAQKDQLVKVFGHLDIEFVEDRASAFKPFNRPAFADMLERIRKGERTGLIAWHPDRLSRNEKDAGEITYMIRTGVIEELKLATYQFENTPEGIWMLQMALSQSQYESAKKGRDVKRGLEQSAKLGFYPAPAPLGYLDDKYSERGKKKKLPDPDRFDLVRKMFDLMLTGEHTPPQIRRIVNEEWGFRGPYGKKMSNSAIYNLFTRTYYYGEFEYPVASGKFYIGSHKPMITRDEYERIQILLGRKNATRLKQHEIIYRGPMRCGECGAMITAEEKTKYQKNGNTHHYTYYHCTKRKDPNCSQKSIEEKELEKQIAKELAKIEIPADFKNWALARLKTQNSQEIDDREKIYGSQRRGYEAVVRKIDNLIDMRADQEITEDEFKHRKEVLLAEKAKFKELLKDTDTRIDKWLEIAERGFNYSEKASAVFADIEDPNTLEAKKEIFATLGSDLILKDRMLSFEWDKLLFPIKEMAKEVRDIHERLEPPKKPMTTKDMEEIYAQNPRLLTVTVVNL